MQTKKGEVIAPTRSANWEDGGRGRWPLWSAHVVDAAYDVVGGLQMRCDAVEMMQVGLENMGVSKNDGTPKSSILIGFSIRNHP